MPIRKISFASGEFYHLYNRGNSKQKIFRSKEDYERFVALLYVTNGNSPLDLREIKPADTFIFERGKSQIAIGAYCLMPNHFHILVTPLVDDGVTSFMRKLTTCYSMYFNKKYSRTGSLFEGRFKSEHVNSDRYLKYLFSYIHLNPVKLVQKDWREVGIKNRAEALNYLKNFQYSSYLDNHIQRPQRDILNQEYFPGYFSSKLDFDRELVEWLSYKSP